MLTARRSWRRSASRVIAATWRRLFGRASETPCSRSARSVSSAGSALRRYTTRPTGPPSYAEKPPRRCTRRAPHATRQASSQRTAGSEALPKRRGAPGSTVLRSIGAVRVRGRNASTMKRADRVSSQSTWLSTDPFTVMPRGGRHGRRYSAGGSGERGPLCLHPASPSKACLTCLLALTSR